MITLFSCPRAFDKHYGIIQRNAITSWTLLRPRPEIILFGEAEGIREICKEMDLIHAPELMCNELGTPYVSDSFAKAQQLAHYDLLAYLNSDLILTSNFMNMAKYVIAQKRKYVVVGGRYDIRVAGPLDFHSADWEKKIGDLCMREGNLNRLATDYFLFNKGIIPQMPAFLVGRAAWDNWLLWRIRDLGLPLVNATGAVIVAHPEHERSEAVAENSYNKQLFKVDLWRWSFTPLDANYAFDGREIHARLLRSYMRRVWVTFVILRYRAICFLRAVLEILHIRR